MQIGYPNAVTLKKLVQTRLNMIRDPGAGPHESSETPPTTKYEPVVYDIPRNPVPPVAPPAAAAAVVDMDSESPLDMTVRRRDSDRQPVPSHSTTTIEQHSFSSTSSCTTSSTSSNCSSSSSSTTISESSREVPINFNMRPSVITKAPPPPIKKRISSMLNNGEIVIKSAVGDNLSPVNCDVFIEEHFRRSLGNTYASIYGNNNNNNNNNVNSHQQKSAGSDTRNSSTSSSSSISSSCSGTNSSSTGLSTSSSLSSSSGISSAASSLGSGSTSSLLGNSVNFSINSHLGNVSPAAARHSHGIPSPMQVDITPLIKIKPDAVLTPQNILPEVRVKTEPGTVQHVRPDSEEEVDDHFAKALGNDTWRMIQEKNMNM